MRRTFEQFVETEVPSGYGSPSGGMTYGEPDDNADSNTMQQWYGSNPDKIIPRILALGDKPQAAVLAQMLNMDQRRELVRAKRAAAQGARPGAQQAVPSLRPPMA